MAKATCFSFLAIACLVIASSKTEAYEKGYYRWPSVHGEQLVFASEGDIWRANLDGSTATRLTTNVQVEATPVISNDGKWIAFEAGLDVADEVYVMPTSGGMPKQLTFEGGSATVLGWTPDHRIVYRSSTEPGPRMTYVLRIVNPEDLSIETIPFLGATAYTFGADKETLYVTRFGLATTRDNARMYRGGRMAQLWRMTLNSEEEPTRLAVDFDAPIRSPMFWNNRIYFVTDKSGTDNIWSLNESGEDLQQHSQFDGWDIKSPTLHEGVITYQRGADLYRFNLSDNSESKIDIDIVTDREDRRIRWIDEPLSYLSDARAGAMAKSAAITARGRVAVAFPGERRRIELDFPQTARSRSAVVGAKEKWVYMILDQDRFGEVWRFPADGLAPGEQLTEYSDAHIWDLYPSPDGTRILFDDSLGRLWSLDIESKLKGLIDTGFGNRDSPFGSITFSHDGRYLAYSKVDERLMQRIVLRDLTSGKHDVVTTGKFESYAPAFSTDLKWLYFLSDRNFSPSPSSPWGDRNTGTTFDNRTEIYALQLTEDSSFPFDPKNELFEDEAKNAEESKGEDESAAASKDESEEKKDEKKDPEIQFEGLADRLWKVPAAPSNYVSLSANAKYLYAIDRDGFAASVKSIAIDDQKPTMKTFASGVRSFSLSADGKTIFLQTRSGSSPVFALVPAGAESPSNLGDSRLRVDDWTLAITPHEEWQQMMLDAWRMHRTFSYDAKLRGVDWDAVLDKYQPLVDRIGHRAELDDILAQMASELGILHSQIVSGDEPRETENGSEAALGAEYEAVADGLKITKIYRGEKDLPQTFGPLRKQGVDVLVGDVITSVNGRNINSSEQLHRQLLNKAGQQIRLDFIRDGEKKSEIVEPISMRAASQLPYQDWLEENRDKVSEVSDGSIGYLHIRAMGSGDMAAFVRDFYEHFDKDGLVIDVRGNSGGNIDSWLLMILQRRVWSFWESQLSGPWNQNMQQTFRGHLVVLINEGTYSDGETFAAGIKALDLAPLIGTTTAGAGIWLSSRNGLVDNGRARIAEFPQFGLDGSWLIEGRGVSPDMEVVNPPLATFNGSDAQLDAALKYLAEKIESEPIPKLRAKPLPALGTNGEDVK